MIPGETEPDDSDRYPGLDEDGRRLLEWMREHPHAPVFRNRSGHRLQAADLAALQAFEFEVRDATVDPRAEPMPSWLQDFLAQALAEVPHYRAYGSPPARLSDLPTIARADLARDIARFVPDSVDIGRLINFRTTGTTGEPLLVASHPQVAGRYLSFHRRALRRFGVELRSGAGAVGVVLLGWQRQCFTYTSISPHQGGAGLAKINLHPDDWRDPLDRGRYLDALAPEVLSGDPLSFAALLELDFGHRPRALMNTSMTLLPGLRRRLEQRFGCPVVDILSMNEAGPIAVHDPVLGAHVLLQHRMVVEIVDRDGRSLPDGERGEIALSGGFNFCLPLVRYRTGDFAALERRAGEWVLAGFEGRAPVRFRTLAGPWINNIDVTHALKPFSLAQYALRQLADGSFAFSGVGLPPGDRPAVLAALEALLGPRAPIAADWPERSEGKLVQYRSELPGAMG